MQSQWDFDLQLFANYASAVTNYADTLNAVTFPDVPYNKITDQVFNTKPFFALLRDTGHCKERRGGLFLQETINIGQSANAAWYTGSGGWKMVTFNGLIALGWDWKFAHDGVVITGEQIVKNEYSDAAIVELIQGTVDVSSLTLPDVVANALIVNNPYGTSSDGTVGNSSAPEGLAVQIDDGTISTTIGQQSRTTYTALKSQVNYNNAQNSSFISSLQSLYTAANKGSMSRVRLLITTESNYNYFWGSLQTPERYIIDPRRLEALGLKTTGGNDLAFNDAVFLLDEAVPTGVASPKSGVSGNGGYIYGINPDYIEFDVHPDRFFSLGEWYKDPYGDQYFLDIFLACALKVTRPNRQFVTWVSGG